MNQQPVIIRIVNFDWTSSTVNPLMGLTLDIETGCRFFIEWIIFIDKRKMA